MDFKVSDFRDAARTGGVLWLDSKDDKIKGTGGWFQRLFVRRGPPSGRSKEKIASDNRCLIEKFLNAIDAEYGSDCKNLIKSVLWRTDVEGSALSSTKVKQVFKDVDTIVDTLKQTNVKICDQVVGKIIENNYNETEYKNEKFHEIMKNIARFQANEISKNNKEIVDSEKLKEELEEKLNGIIDKFQSSCQLIQGMDSNTKDNIFKIIMHPSILEIDDDKRLEAMKLIVQRYADFSGNIFNDNDDKYPKSEIWRALTGIHMNPMMKDETFHPELYKKMKIMEQIKNDESVNNHLVEFKKCINELFYIYLDENIIDTFLEKAVEIYNIKKLICDFVFNDENPGADDKDNFVTDIIYDDCNNRKIQELNKLSVVLSRKRMLNINVLLMDIVDILNKKISAGNLQESQINKICDLKNKLSFTAIFLDNFRNAVLLSISEKSGKDFYSKGIGRFDPYFDQELSAAIKEHFGVSVAESGKINLND